MGATFALISSWWGTGSTSGLTAGAESTASLTAGLTAEYYYAADLTVGAAAGF